MLYKGIVVSLKKEYAIILTEENEYLRIGLKNKMFKGQKILFTDEDILQTLNNSNDWKERIYMSKRYLAIAASIVVLITAGLFGYKFLSQPGSTDGNTEPALNMLSDEATTVLTLDINPSIELYLDENGVVIDVQSLNDDAATLDLSQFIGMSAEDAVDGIVALATEAGFINETDTTEDYVLLTVADINEDDVDDCLPIEERLRDRINTSDNLSLLNVALMKATLADIKEAEGKGIPFGLYVINGMVESDGEYLSIKDFFANSENKEIFLGKGHIYQMSNENQVALAERLMAELQNAGVDVTAYREMLGQTDADVGQILQQIRTLYKQYDPDTETGNENGNGNGNINDNDNDQSQTQNQSTNQSQNQNPNDDDEDDDDEDDESGFPGGRR